MSSRHTPRSISLLRLAGEGFSTWRAHRQRQILLRRDFFNAATRPSHAPYDDSTTVILTFRSVLIGFYVVVINFHAVLITFRPVILSSYIEILTFHAAILTFALATPTFHTAMLTPLHAKLDFHVTLINFRAARRFSAPHIIKIGNNMPYHPPRIR